MHGGEGEGGSSSLKEERETTVQMDERETSIMIPSHFAYGGESDCSTSPAVYDDDESIDAKLKQQNRLLDELQRDEEDLEKIRKLEKKFSSSFASLSSPFRLIQNSSSSPKSSQSLSHTTQQFYYQNSSLEHQGLLAEQNSGAQDGEDIHKDFTTQQGNEHWKQIDLESATMNTLEHVFNYYQRLYVLMKEECSSQSVNYFSDAYNQLLIVLKQKFEELKREGALLQAPDNKSLRGSYSLKDDTHIWFIDNITMQAKCYLYDKYMKGLRLHFKDRHDTNFTQNFDKLFMLPQHDIAFNESETITKRKLNSNDNVINDNSDIYQWRNIEDNDSEDEQGNEDLEDLVHQKPPQKQSVQSKFLLTAQQVIFKSFPWIGWIPSYKEKFCSNLRNDIFAGLTVGSMLVPQAMAYAILAGLPPIYGFYTSFVPLLVYAFFGSCRHLQVGPSALSSLLVFSAISKLKPLNIEEGVQYAAILSLMTGLLQILAGVFQLGSFLVNLLSHPIISGFTSAAAVLIATSQLKNIVGISHPESKQWIVLVIEICKNLNKVHWGTLLFSLLWLTILAVLKFGFIRVRNQSYSFKLIPAPLIIVILSTFFVYLLKITGGDNAVTEVDGAVYVYGIRIAGEIESTIPVIPYLPNWKLFKNFETFQTLMASVLPIVVVGFLESISIARYAANLFKYDISVNQELISIGLGSLSGSFFRAFPSTGCFSRTAVNIGCNASSQISSLVVASIVLVTAMFLTPLFYYLPKCALSSIILISLISLIDIKTLILTYQTKGKDCLLLILTFICTLIFGIEEGILIALAASLFLVLYRASRPRMVILGRQAGTADYASTFWKSNVKLIQIPGVLICRLDSDLFFANISYFRDKLRQFVRESTYTVHAVVLDAGSINQVDSSAVTELKEISQHLSDSGIDFYVAQVKENVMRVFIMGKIYKQIPKKNFFPNVHQAALSAKKEIIRKLLIQKEQYLSNQREY